MTYTHMRINRPVFDPSQTAPFYPRFTVQPRTLSAPVALSAPLSSRTRSQTAPSVPTMPSPAPDHTTRPAPLCASLCASTRAPDAQTAAHAVTLSSALHAQTAVERAVSHCERFYAVPRVLHHPRPRTRPERPRKPAVSLPTRAHAPAHARTLCTCAHCSNLHNVDRSTLCKAPKVRKMRKNTCKTPLTAVHYSRTQQARPAGTDVQAPAPPPSRTRNAKPRAWES